MLLPGIIRGLNLRTERCRGPRSLHTQPGITATPPGTVLRRGGERIVVQCGDGPIEILAWSREEAGFGIDASGSGEAVPLASRMTSGEER